MWVTPTLPSAVVSISGSPLPAIVRTNKPQGTADYPNCWRPATYGLSGKFVGKGQGCSTFNKTSMERVFVVENRQVGR